jgi:trehalose synthase
MGALTEVTIGALPPSRFRELLGDRYDEVERGIALGREVFAGRVVWHVNSTAKGGGVVELLQSLLAYARGAGVDNRWVVIRGTPEFFDVTKRVHNRLHGSTGDGGPLGPEQRAIYESALEENARELADLVRPRDIVFLHDPQTAGMAAPLHATGATIVWRCHVGRDLPNDLARQAWDFLRPYVEPAHAFVFSRPEYAWEGLDPDRVWTIAPSIDVFSPKNQDLGDEECRAILAHVGLAIDGTEAAPVYTRYDGTPGRVDRRCEVLSTGPPPSFEDPLVVQISRWDRLKDHAGVMTGFAEHVAARSDAHLILAGPTVHSVADDPESAEVLDEVVAVWRELPHARRTRVHLACLPMGDIEENAAIVNALQRRATVVVQKSLQEGFGLTVAEAMWKARPVVASAVGGILDQVEDGVTGVLLDDPADLDTFGELVLGLLSDPERARAIGVRAREHVRRYFLANRHAVQYIDLFAAIIAARG